MTGRRRTNRAYLSSVASSVRASWDLLSQSARRRYVAVVGGQIATGLLDLIGIALVGLVGVVGTSAVSGSRSSFDWMTDAVNAPDRDPLAVAAALALVAAAVLLARSIAYAALLRLNYRLLARSQAEVVRSLFDRFMAQPITGIQERSSQSVTYALGNGTTAAVTALLGSLSVILTDTVLLILLGVGLFLVDPVTTVVSAAYLGIVGFVVHASLARWSARNGEVLGASGIDNIVSVQETLGLYRELWATGRLGGQAEATRRSLAVGIDARATKTLIEQIPRVVYDAALVVGALLLAVWQVRVSSLEAAIVTMLLFLAAASRVLPSLMRINGQLIQMRSAAAQALPTYELAASLGPGRHEGATPARVGRSESPPTPVGVELEHVTFRYPQSEEPALHDVSFAVRPGRVTALVGPTGSGKSTLADVIVGLVPPAEGSVYIDGCVPMEFLTQRPGSVSYVPQRVQLIDGTVRTNVAIGLPPAEIDDDRVWAALRRAHVDDVVRELPQVLDTRVGEHGLRLSGGQRQRLGLARALYAVPSLLILDEATSALDGETERAIAAGISDLRGGVTVIVIAHRLAALRDADHVVYLESGRVAAQGTFAEVLEQSAAFARQVAHLSLPGDAVDWGL